MKFTKYVKLPRYRRFSYQPQFFDPENEQIKTRQESVRLAMEENNKPRASFKGAFHRDRSTETQRRFVRLVVILAVISMVFGYLAMGSRAFYVAFWVALPFYFLYRWSIYKKRKKDSVASE